MDSEDYGIQIGKLPMRCTIVLFLANRLDALAHLGKEKVGGSDVHFKVEVFDEEMPIAFHPI